jgi:L-alanine-DL-glutamate epimerase-like enolase superfamily enzyme
MKITRTAATRAEIPLAKPNKVSNGYGSKLDADAIVVGVETEQGLVGLGEADPRVAFAEDTPGPGLAGTSDGARLAWANLDRWSVA